MKTCSECKWFQLLPEEKDKLGECYRNPPTVFLQTIPIRTALDPNPKMMTQRSTFYPVVNFHSRACGEFELYKQNNAVVSLAHDGEEKT